jgi:RimJ/RimL family protein N-acetyltransferase
MPLAPVPPLRTPRLTVREIVAADLADLMAVNGDPEVTRFLPYATWTGPDDALAWHRRMEALVAAGGTRQLVMGLNEDASVVGTVLLFKHDEGSRRVELGYTLARAHWGRGLAREALAAVLTHAFGAMGLRRVEAEVDPANLASNALLARLGFTREGLLRDKYEVKGRTYGVHAWGLLAGEWVA